MRYRALVKLWTDRVDRSVYNANGQVNTKNSVCLSGGQLTHSPSLMTTSQNDGCLLLKINLPHSALASCVFSFYATGVWPLQDGGRISCAQEPMRCLLFIMSMGLAACNRQRRWCRLATGYAGVDKLPDYLRSDTKDGKKSTFLDSGHFLLSNSHYWKIIDHREWGRSMQVNGAFHSTEESWGINTNSVYCCLTSGNRRLEQEQNGDIFNIEQIPTPRLRATGGLDQFKDMYFNILYVVKDTLKQSIVVHLLWLGWSSPKALQQPLRSELFPPLRRSRVGL